MKIKKEIYVDIPQKIYYIDYIYDYRDCEYALREIFESKFFYDRDSAYNYAKLKGLKAGEYDIEELYLGALNKDDV